MSKNLDNETRQLVKQDIIQWVRRNIKKQVPNQYIADRYRIKPYQVGHITKNLVMNGDLKRLTKNTYETVEREQVQSTLPVEEKPTEQPTELHKLSKDVEALARQFVWETGIVTLKPFVAWLIERGL